MSRRLLTIPNLLTASRILFLPWLAWAVAHGKPTLSLVLLSSLGATDILDGWIARRYGWQTAFGKLIDPVADKLMLCVLVVFLVARTPGWRGDPPLSAVAGTLLLAREFLITGLRAWTASFGLVISADNMGKAKAFAQNFGLAFLVYGGRPTFYVYENGLPAYDIGIGIIWISIGLSYWSMGRYIALAWRAIQKRGLAAHEA